MNTRKLGTWGEQIALAEYVKRHYIPVCHGYNTRFGEIDLIVENDSNIVFVEVKLRKNNRFASAREYVILSKQQKIQTSAAIWISKYGNEKQPRFDVVEIYAPEGENTKQPDIIILENAF